jgi:hypothetical protein
MEGKTVRSESKKDYVLKYYKKFTNLVFEGKTPHDALIEMGVNVSKSTASEYFSASMAKLKPFIFEEPIVYKKEIATKEESFRDFYSIATVEYQTIKIMSKL